MTFPETPLKHLCVRVTRGAVPTYAGDDDPGFAIVVGQACQRPDGTFDPTYSRRQATGIPYAEKGALAGGEVLVNSTGTGTLGRAALFPGSSTPTFADTHVTVVAPAKHRADSRFLAYVLRREAFRAYVEDALSVGATKQKELNVDELRRLRVPAPERRAQAWVADFLDRECDRLEMLGAARAGARTSSLLQRFIVLLDEYRDALITEAVTGQLDVTRLSDSQLDESAHAAVEGERPEVLSA